VLFSLQATMMRFTRLGQRAIQSTSQRTVATAATQNAQGSNKSLYVLAGLAGAAGVAYMSAPDFSANEGLPPPNYPWAHKNFFTAFDHMAIRRGYTVYREVCSACHSLRHVYWRHLVGVVGTEDEVKEWAAEHTYEDGPNSDGEMFDRPGQLTDRMPMAYPNEEAARAGNNGAVPPELSLMKKARPNGEDYIFALLTGYRDAPHGLNVREGLHYNPYFPGGSLAMAQALFDDMVEYEDGTEASISQMAKDVSTFLCWTAEPEHDTRKRLGCKALLLTGLMIVPTLYWKRFKWAVVHTRQVKFAELPKRFY